MAKIKLWYQSMSRQQAWSGYSERLRAILEKSAICGRIAAAEALK